MLARVLFALVLAIVGAVPVAWMALVPSMLVVRAFSTVRRWLRGEPPSPPASDPTPAEHLSVAVAFGIATTCGVVGTLLFGWATFPGQRPPGALACALIPALLSGGASGLVVWWIPAAAGFSILPALQAAALAAGVAAGLAVVVAGALGG
jgi:hypothetical protein